MKRTKLPRLSTQQRSEVLTTLTRERLYRYLGAAANDEHVALRLYVLNSKVSATLLTDLHYVEIALRNKFDEALSTAYGLQWFDDPGFLALVKQPTRDNITKAKRAAQRARPPGAPVPRGKVIAELTFGFWLTLTDGYLEPTLWTPVLHKVFRPGKPPKRSTLNGLLEKLRVLRNRIAHHEPIFHLKLREHQSVMHQVMRLLCPATHQVAQHTSTTARSAMQLERYRQFGRT